jgi:hypothetical protein
MKTNSDLQAQRRLSIAGIVALIGASLLTPRSLLRLPSRC